MKTSGRGRGGTSGSGDCSESLCLASAGVGWVERSALVLQGRADAVDAGGGDGLDPGGCSRLAGGLVDVGDSARISAASSRARTV